jgi:hypothetical protein
MVLTGAWTNGAPRAPITDLSQAEMERLRAALIEAGVATR